MELTNIPASSTLGFLSLGFYTMNPPRDLSSLGMPGCTQYIRPLSSDAFVPAGPTTTLSLMIPNKATLVGLAAYSQAAVLAPGVNLGGLIVSNGGVIRLGM